MGAQGNAAPVIIKRKKVTGGDGHHGGAWKVAYADFVTAMMAFFLLMWLLNATTEKQRKGIADYFSPTVPLARVSGGGNGLLNGDTIFSENSTSRMGRGASSANPTEAAQARGATGVDWDSAKQAETEMLARIEAALMGFGGESLHDDPILRHVLTYLTDEGLVIELTDLPGAPLFDPGTNAPMPVLSSLAEILIRNFDFVENAVAIEAHVAAQPIVVAANTVWPMSAQRADAMRVLLEYHGLASERIARVTGHADREPAQPDPMDTGNNRLEVILLRASR